MMMRKLNVIGKLTQLNMRIGRAVKVFKDHPGIIEEGCCMIAACDEMLSPSGSHPGEQYIYITLCMNI